MRAPIELMKPRDAARLAAQAPKQQHPHQHNHRQLAAATTEHAAFSRKLFELLFADDSCQTLDDFTTIQSGHVSPRFQVMFSNSNLEEFRGFFNALSHPQLLNRSRMVIPLIALALYQIFTMGS
jgi:hypothetical protein